MGTLVIQIGQAGNQIGLQLLDYFDQTQNQYSDTYMRRHDQNIFHSLMIDTEPKTLKNVTENKKRYPYVDAKNVLTFQNGRGNNWALGYVDAQLKEKKKGQIIKIQSDVISQFQNVLVTDQAKIQNVKQENEGAVSSKYLQENTIIIESVLDMVRREIEKIDYFIGINMIFSLGGGTGSGLGTRLLKEFREIFNDIQLINTVVLPSNDGETTLQHYNCLLSIAQMQQFSDSIIYFENDKINDFLNYTKTKQVEKVVDLSNINQYISSNLHAMMRINDYQKYDRFYFDILQQNTALDDFKFLQLQTAPFYFEKSSSNGPECSWEKLIDSLLAQINIEPSNNLSQNLRQNSSKGSCLSATTIYKSQDVIKTLKQQEKLMSLINKKLTQQLNPVSWNPDCLTSEFVQETLKNCIDQKSALLVSNRSCIADQLQIIYNKAHNKFNSQAFLHWYYKYGMEKEDFLNAFTINQNIISNYNSLDKLQP